MSPPRGSEAAQGCGARVREGTVLRRERCPRRSQPRLCWARCSGRVPVPSALAGAPSPLQRDLNSGALSSVPTPHLHPKVELWKQAAPQTRVRGQECSSRRQHRKPRPYLSSSTAASSSSWTCIWVDCSALRSLCWSPGPMPWLRLGKQNGRGILSPASSPFRLLPPPLLNASANQGVSSLFRTEPSRAPASFSLIVLHLQLGWEPRAAPRPVAQRPHAPGRKGAPGGLGAPSPLSSSSGRPLLIWAPSAGLLLWHLC